MAADDKKQQQLVAALAEHSSEGIDILSSEPSRLIRITILIVITMLLCGVAWSFVGRADVIVSVPGSLAPESEVRRIYAPIKGDMEDVYVTEGMPVSEGDLLFRLNARGVVDLAARAMDAQLKLVAAQQEYDLYPENKRFAELKIEAFQATAKAEEGVYEQRMTASMEILAQSQKLQLEKVRFELARAKGKVDGAKAQLEKFQRLLESPGGGGISRKQVGEKKAAYTAAIIGYRQEQTKLAELEIKLNKEYAQKLYELESSYKQLAEARARVQGEVLQLKTLKNRVEVGLRSAKMNAEAAAQISFDNIDEDNFLRVLAPTAGVVTFVNYAQAGEKVPDNQPVVGIAASDVRMVLQLEIPEQNRGRLREQMPVKMKFNAFPYQRYGFITGRLEFIAPNTVISPETKKPVYRGRVGLESYQFEAGGQTHALRYGMRARAEIVIERRRMIDLALAPFKQLKR